MGRVREREVDTPLLEQVDGELRRAELVVGEAEQPLLDLRLEFDRPLHHYFTDEMSRARIGRDWICERELREGQGGQPLHLPDGVVLSHDERGKEWRTAVQVELTRKAEARVVAILRHLLASYDDVVYWVPPSAITMVTRSAKLSSGSERIMVRPYPRRHFRSWHSHGLRDEVSPPVPPPELTPAKPESFAGDSEAAADDGARLSGQETRPWRGTRSAPPSRRRPALAEPS